MKIITKQELKNMKINMVYLNYKKILQNTLSALLNNYEYFNNETWNRLVKIISNKLGEIRFLVRTQGLESTVKMILDESCGKTEYQWEEQRMMNIKSFIANEKRKEVLNNVNIRL